MKEHRYFGESLPRGPESYTREGLKYLTLDNVMSDALYLIQHGRRSVEDTERSKVIVFGGTPESLFHSAEIFSVPLTDSMYYFRFVRRFLGHGPSPESPRDRFWSNSSWCPN